LCRELHAIGKKSFQSSSIIFILSKKGRRLFVFVVWHKSQKKDEKTIECIYVSKEKKEKKEDDDDEDNNNNNNNDEQNIACVQYD
tara:strand:+ start:117 stop:371 length:255 start_codon:yes stop_codon:yes gene_type:complete